MRVWEVPAGSATPARGPPCCRPAVGRSTSGRGTVRGTPAPGAPGPGPGPLHRYLSLALECLCCTEPACPPPSPRRGQRSPPPPSRRAATGRDGGRGDGGSGGGRHGNGAGELPVRHDNTRKWLLAVRVRGRRAGNMSDNEDKCERGGRGEAVARVG